MMRPSRLLLVMVMLSVTFAQLLSNQRAAAQSQGVTPQQQPRDYFDLPIHIETPIQPIPVRGTDDKWYLVYHLFLTNVSYSDLTLKSVEVFDAERGSTLARYGNVELSDIDRFDALIPTPPRSELPNNVYPRQIAGGRTGALFFWLTVDAPNAIPSALRHRFVFERNPLIRLRRNASSDEAGDMVLDNFKVRVSTDRPIVIGPPLRGGLWRCGNGPAYNTNHQVLSVREGRMRIAQRFAIDFQKVDAGGNELRSPFSNQLTNSMFYSYGAEVLAVADGVVAFVKDGIPENVPQGSGPFIPAVPITGETIAGNWVSIDLGRNRYAFYAHLQPGSIRVKVGDRVRRGQVIGLVGNSGNTTGPHLHFQIGDANSLLGCEGMPFVFSSFEMVGQTRRRALEMPLNTNVVRFP